VASQVSTGGLDRGAARSGCEHHAAQIAVLAAVAICRKKKVLSHNDAMVSGKVCWSLKRIDRVGVGSRIMALLSHVSNPDTLLNYSFCLLQPNL
jgi:hypothetical protein